MATVRLSDVVVPAVYETYQSVDSPEKTAFFESGVAVTDAMLTAKASTGVATCWMFHSGMILIQLSHLTCQAMIQQHQPHQIKSQPELRSHAWLI